MTKKQVVSVLEYAIQVVYETVKDIPDEDIDEIIYKVNKGVV